MILTEKEARSRWCPFGRRLGDTIEGELYVSNNPNASRHCKCVGSDCMAWRWFEPTAPPPMPWVREIPPLPTTHPETGKSTEDWTDEDIQAWAEKHKPKDGFNWKLDLENLTWFIPRLPKARRGYCGKAGKPDHE